jgi:hypothetical protein
MKKRSRKDDKNRNNISKTDFEKSGNIFKQHINRKLSE